MNPRRLIAHMDGMRCGIVVRTDTGDPRFSYDEDHRKVPDATPVSLSMPLLVSEHRKRSSCRIWKG